MDEHYLYISSRSSSHSNNTPSHFTNTLYTPIILPSNVRFQCGVVNFLYPKSFFTLLKNDEDSSILLYNKNEEVIRNYTLPRNIGNGEDVEEILDLLNFPLLRWNEGLGRCELVFDDEEEVSVIFGSRLATVLGFDYGRHYNKTGVAPKHPRTDDGGVDFVICESDIVIPSIFGDELLPVLDAFILEGAGGRGFTSTVYKTLNTFHLSEIRIKMVDQLKRPIIFDPLYTSICVLHIRPLYNDEWCSSQLTSLSRWTGSSV